jgi:hypothetical protein
VLLGFGGANQVAPEATDRRMPQVRVTEAVGVVGACCRHSRWQGAAEGPHLPRLLRSTRRVPSPDLAARPSGPPLRRRAIYACVRWRRDGSEGRQDCLRRADFQPRGFLKGELGDYPVLDHRGVALVADTQAGARQVDLEPHCAR